MLVQNVELQVRDGIPDHAAAFLLDVCGTQRSTSYVYGRFRDAVHVDQQWFLIAVIGNPRPQGLQIKSFAAEDHQP